jgi:superfamily II DNA or RNA helicase
MSLFGITIPESLTNIYKKFVSEKSPVKSPSPKSPRFSPRKRGGKSDSPTREVELKYARRASPKPRKEDEEIDTICLTTDKKLQLREHQLRIIEFMLAEENRGIVCAFEVGTGKTLTAVAVAHCLLVNNIVSKVIVVSPKSLVSNFKKELYAAYGRTPEIESLGSKYVFYTNAAFAAEVAGDGIRECEDALLIIDEAHEFRTAIPTAIPVSIRTGKARKDPPRSYAAVNCAIRARKILLLTATPVFNAKRDVLNLAAMVKGEAPLSSVPESPLEIMKYFDKVFAFFSPGDAASRDMPTMTTVRNVIRMSPEYYKEYYSVELSQHIDWTSDPWIFLSGLRRATNAIANSPKVSWTIDRIASHIDDKNYKVVIYSAFIDSGIRIIQKELSARNIGWREVQGSMDSGDRDKSVRDFNSGKIQVLCVTKAGGQGLDLKGTKDVILLESSWNPSQETQVIGRAVRVGSHSHLPETERKVEVFHLILAKPEIRFRGDKKGSADELMQIIVERKADENPKFVEILKRVSL